MPLQRETSIAFQSEAQSHRSRADGLGHGCDAIQKGFLRGVFGLITTLIAEKPLGCLRSIRKTKSALINHIH